MKKVALVVLGTALQIYGEKLTDQQEVLTLSADIIIDVYAAESVLLRSRAADGADAPSGGGTGVCPRRRKQGRDCSPDGARCDGRRRRASNAARSAAAPPQGSAGQHRGARQAIADAVLDRHGIHLLIGLRCA